MRQLLLDFAVANTNVSECVCAPRGTAGSAARRRLGCVQEFVDESTRYQSRSSRGVRCALLSCGI